MSEKILWENFLKKCCEIRELTFVPEYVYQLLWYCPCYLIRPWISKQASRGGWEHLEGEKQREEWCNNMLSSQKIKQIIKSMLCAWMWCMHMYAHVDENTGCSALSSSSLVLWDRVSPWIWWAGGQRTPVILVFPPQSTMLICMCMTTSSLSILV